MLNQVSALVVLVELDRAQLSMAVGKMLSIFSKSGNFVHVSVPLLTSKV